MHIDHGLGCMSTRVRENFLGDVAVHQNRALSLSRLNLNKRKDDFDHCNHHGRNVCLLGVSMGVVIASEFCKMLLPRNPVTTTPITTATPSKTATMIATRFPRPILVLLTIKRIAGSLSMDQTHCIDCADAMGRRAAGQAPANAARTAPK
jgi:hypothetical protein